MNKLNQNPSIPPGALRTNERATIIQYLREHAIALNQLIALAPGGTATPGIGPPTSGNYVKGAYVQNTNPSELGTLGAKYVVRGWICVASGNPGTWVEDRGLTGN